MENVPQQTKPPDPSKLTPTEKQAVHNAFCGAVAEVLFIVLPLLVLGIVLRYKHLQHEILSSAEWSFAAAVLFGQGLVKLVGPVAERGGIHAERVGMYFALILVLGLVPSLVILSLVLLSPHPGFWLTFAQITLCVLGFLTFFGCAAVGTLARIDAPKPKAS
jgi:hypothetical protein